MKGKSLKIAVISDLHVGKTARSVDLTPNEPDKNRKLDKDFVGVFEKFVRDSGIRANYLFVLGDISNQGQPGEYKLAAEKIKTVAEALKVNKSKILYVPGNHDVDWEVLKTADDTGVRYRQRYDPISQIFCKEIKPGYKGNLLESPYIAVATYDNLYVMAYNSAHHDGPNLEDHYGHVDIRHIEEIEKKLSAEKGLKDKVRAFLVHHHPVQWSSAVPGVDLSAMQNAERLMEVLSYYNFDFVVHGHRHEPHFKSRIDNSGYPIVILGAGSFSAELDARYAGYCSNLFHVITVDGRTNSKHVQGDVRSWAYSIPRGWRESEEKHNGIQHREPFGLYDKPHVIKERLLKIAEKIISKKNHLTKSDIELLDPQLSYIHESLNRRVWKELCDEKGWKFHMLADSEYIILSERG